MRAYLTNIHVSRICLVQLAGSLIFLGAASPATAVPGLSEPNIKQVTERVFVLVGDMNLPDTKNQGFNANSTFVVTSNGVVVIDPGGSRKIGRMIITEIKKRSAKPVTHVFNSHYHPDHWLGNHAFSELKPLPRIIGHPNMYQRASETGENALRRIAKRTKGAHADTRIVLPNSLAAGGEQFIVGDRTFVVYHPDHAHTRGDLVVYIPEEKTVVTGDVFFHMRTPGLQDADPKGNALALEHLASLEIEHVVPGHGPVTDKKGLHYMIDYLSLLRHEVEKYYRNGFTDFEMLNTIDVGKYRHMSGFETRFPVNVNKMYQDVVRDYGRQWFYYQINVKPKPKFD